MTSTLFIIQPSHYRSRSNLTLHKVRRRSLVGLTLPYLAALTPREWKVRLIDEQLMDIDFKAPVDLAAITSWTMAVTPGGKGIFEASCKEKRIYRFCKTGRMTRPITGEFPCEKPYAY
jgi:hypothetical protein